jgi:hypothetical protein
MFAVPCVSGGHIRLTKACYEHVTWETGKMVEVSAVPALLTIRS